MRIARDLSLALLATTLLGRLIPAGDALRATLLLLPLVAAGLAILGRTTGRRYPGATARCHLLLLVAVVALALSRRALGLALDDELLIAALALLLALHLASLLGALRSLLPGKLPDWPHPVFLLLPWLVYLAIQPWSAAQHPLDGDEPYYMLVTHSLAEDFDADLTDDYADGASLAFSETRLEPQPGDPVGPNGERYSRHNLLLPLLLAPAYRLAGKTGALVVMALLAALLAYFTLRLGRHYFGARPTAGLFAWALLAFTPPLLLYSYQVWVEVPAALLSVLALDRALAQRPGRATARDWALLLLPIVLLPLLKIRFMLLAGPLALLAWWHAGRSKRLLAAGGAAIGVLGLGILVHNQWTYGNALKIHHWQELDLSVYSWKAFFGGATGLLFDSAFGLFATAPVWLLLAAGVWALLRRRHPLWVHALVFVGPYLLIVAPRLEWFGGWSPPFRYPMVALPLLALAMIPVFEARRGAGARALLAGLGGLTLALTLLWLAHPGWTYNFADGRTYLFDHLGRRFGSDFAVFFPSSTRWRSATWIWPLVALPLTTGLVWGLRRRRRGAAGVGVAVLLFAIASLPALAARMPTHRIEFEDAHVKKRGGHVHPFRWVIERPRYPGGWVLREGESLSAPVVPAGDRLRLRFHLRYVRNAPTPLSLEIRADDQRLGLWEAADPGDWQWLELDDQDWPAGARLVLAVHGPPGMAPTSGVILDRVELAWR